MIAWEWTVEKAREGEEEKTEKKKTRKISQTAQVSLLAGSEGLSKGRGREEGLMKRCGWMAGVAMEAWKGGGRVRRGTKQRATGLRN